MNWWIDWMNDSEALRERREVQALREEWVGLLKRYPWSHFVTLTLETERSRDVVERMVLEYIVRLEARLGQRWWWAYAVEGGNSIRPHAHLLLGGLSRSAVTEAKLREAWGRRGLIEVVDAADRANAEPYLVKALERDYEHIDVGAGIEASVRRWHQLERHRARVRA